MHIRPAAGLPLCFLSTFQDTREKKHSSCDMINYAMKPVDESQTFNQPIHAHRL